MQLSNTVVLSERINQLRSIDKLVDISKSTIQIDIMIVLSKGGSTTAEIAKEIGQRRKAITDAMRKLRVKGLVDEVLDEESGNSSIYELTSSGSNCLNTLLEFTGSDSNLAQGTTLGRNLNFHEKGILPLESTNLNKTTVSPLDQFSDIGSFPMAAVLSELILILGTSKGNVMSRKTIAKTLGLSEQRTESYLEVYLNGSPKLFGKFTVTPKPSRALTIFGLRSKSRKMETIYGLTNEGLQYFYKLPSYSRLKQSVSYKLLSKITGTSHPKSIFKRLTMILCGGGSLSILSLLLPFGYITSGIWLFMAAFLGGITLIDALLYNSM